MLKPAAEGFTKLYWNIALKIVAESLSSIKMCTAMIPGGHTLGIIAKGEKNVGCFEKQKICSVLSSRITLKVSAGLFMLKKSVAVK